MLRVNQVLTRGPGAGGDAAVGLCRRLFWHFLLNSAIISQGPSYIQYLCLGALRELRENISGLQQMSCTDTIEQVATALSDPDLWKQSALNKTYILRVVFHCIPRLSDHIPGVANPSSSLEILRSYTFFLTSI